MSKYTTVDTRNFNVFFLKKYHNFKLGEQTYGRNIIWSRDGDETGRINYDLLLDADNPRIALHYKSRTRGEQGWTSLHYSVSLLPVTCHFGGKRWYFGCPRCNRRVAVLYADDNYFVCRVCANLTYESCQEGKRMRGYPWKVLTDDWRAEEILKTVKRTHYRGKPTIKYQKCLDLWNTERCAVTAEQQLLNRL